MSPEAVLAAGYAAFLATAAFALEWLSSHTHQRALRFRTAGFTYDQTHDHWLCPQGEHLWPHALDQERRLVRYRARAHVCNACFIKHRCTDSDHGREIVRALDPWPHSEAGRFHRVIAVSMITLGLLIALAEMFRHHTLPELALLVPLAWLLTRALRRLLLDLRLHPANFPPQARSVARAQALERLSGFEAARSPRDP